jgi:Nucleotidyltransferase domain/Domain of unknown function (DUF4037)
MSHELSNAQRELVDSLARRLGEIPGVAAVVLGGSYARGFARPGSDLDLGVFYSEAAPFDVAAVRALAASVNDTPDPVVTGFYVWGPWVNGGAWLTIGGQRVDLLYRSLEHQARVIADANAGRFELHWGQQAPFGFFGPTYLGELAICRPLFDPGGRVAALKREVAEYPEALRRAIVQAYLWQAEFSLESFAPKFAAGGEVLGAVGCLTRLAHQLVLVLFALNRRHLLSDKTALAEIAGFALAPPQFGERVAALLARPGREPAALAASVATAAGLVAETVALAGPLYRRPH